MMQVARFPEVSFDTIGKLKAWGLWRLNLSVGESFKEGEPLMDAW